MCAVTHTTASASGASQDGVWSLKTLCRSMQQGTSNLYDVIGRAVLRRGKRIYSNIQQDSARKQRYRTQPKANIQQYTAI